MQGMRWVDTGGHAEGEGTHQRTCAETHPPHAHRGKPRNKGHQQAGNSKRNTMACMQGPLVATGRRRAHLFDGSMFELERCVFRELSKSPLAKLHVYFFASVNR